jgi:anaerobic dimethyl sulfoxide reductase subunit B (iron-sulfur subunit)
MATEYGFTFDDGHCIQCYGCEVACRTWRGLELGVKWRSMENVWLGRYPEAKSMSASVACMHCADPKCVEVCPVGAIKKRGKDGIVVVDRGKCIGCKKCVEECVFKAPKFGADGRMQKCDLCVHDIDHDREFPPCVETCPTGALRLVKMYPKEKEKEEQYLKELISV